MASRPLWKRLWYGFLHVVCRLAAVVCFRMRVAGVENMPRRGGVLVCSNHQSFFDPVIAGLVLNRRLNYLARESLFRVAAFRWLIQSLDAIPIDREGGGLSGLKETLRRLKQGEMVLIFPEGTRTPDGELQPLKPGFIAVARRAKVPLLPMAIDGAFSAWPRYRKVPRLAEIHVAVGPPLLPDEVARLSDEELLERLFQAMRQCFERARVRRRGCRPPADRAQRADGVSSG